MRRYSNLFSKIVEYGNIELAYNRARKGKNWQSTVQKITNNKDELLLRLRESLINKTFTTSQYKTKTIFEPKKRTIYILPFYPDRIVQHAILNILSPIWDKLMIYDSYSCRVGKGQHQASKKCMCMVKKNEYCLQCDISKFYPSINHEILFDIIQEKVKDKDLLWLLKDIIGSIGGETNTPIGNYTSQWFGNIYMNKVDMRVKHVYHCKNYIRYCDDFLFFSNDKERLKMVAKDIEQFLHDKLRLKLSKCSLYHTYQGVDFLGYRHFPSGKILVRKRTAKRVKKSLKQIPYLYHHHRITAEQARSKVASAYGWLKHANSYNLRNAINFDELKEEVKAYV